jgi:UDPglucose--hexose-1-phosphate uridylyltransferase
MSEIRYDRLNNTHVIIAPERLRRPDCDLLVQDDKAPNDCPFCEGNESMTPPEIFAIRAKGSFKNESGWSTRVIPNLYKALQIETPHKHHYGQFEYLDGFGAHEIIIDTPQHHSSMLQWSEENISNWLKTLRARVADLRRDRRITYISLFKNEGFQSGSTQSHSHTQLIGLPIIPQSVNDHYIRSYDHYRQSGEAIMESILLQEEQDGKRIISKEGDFTVFAPYASAYPFEVMISSKKVLGEIDRLHDETIEALSPILLETLKKLKRQLGCFAFNLIVSTPPLQAESFSREIMESVDAAHRFYIRIIPRIYRYGGFETATGVIINPVAPEMAARLLRESNI